MIARILVIHQPTMQLGSMDSVMVSIVQSVLGIA